jgi:hypothetical protein
MLLPPRKLPAWLDDAATEAEHKITSVEADDVPAEGSPAPSEAPAVGEPD